MSFSKDMMRAQKIDVSDLGWPKHCEELARSRTMTDIIGNIGPAMQRRRAVLDISLDEVAKRAGTSKSHIWELENGRSVNPTIRMLLAVAAALNTSINTLLGADISQPILSDDELELIQHHRRIFKREA
jgi:DNA-binding XRE family transcriptional regulator